MKSYLITLLLVATLSFGCSEDPAKAVIYGEIDDVIVEIRKITFIDETATILSFVTKNEGSHPHLLFTVSEKNPIFRMEVFDDNTNSWTGITPSACGSGFVISTLAAGEVLQGGLTFDEAMRERLYRVGIALQTPATKGIQWSQPFRQETLKPNKTAIRTAGSLLKYPITPRIVCI